MAGERGIHRRLEFELTHSLRTRFAGKVGEPNAAGCQIWTGALRNGYGAIKHKGRVLSAHVVSYRIHHGEIQDGHIVRHSCDVKACVNPDHLSTGTPADNIADARRTGAMVAAKGEELPAAKIRESDVLNIWALRITTGDGAVLISRRLGLTVSQVRGVIHDGCWSHVVKPTEAEAAAIAGRIHETTAKETA